MGVGPSEGDPSPQDKGSRRGGPILASGVSLADHVLVDRFVAFGADDVVDSSVFSRYSNPGSFTSNSLQYGFASIFAMTSSLGRPISNGMSKRLTHLPFLRSKNETTAF